MCFVVIANRPCVCFQTATGKNLIYIFITLFDIINFIFDICIGVCVCFWLMCIMLHLSINCEWRLKENGDSAERSHTHTHTDWIFFTFVSSGWSVDLCLFKNQRHCICRITLGSFRSLFLKFKWASSAQNILASVRQSTQWQSWRMINHSAKCHHEITIN